MIEITKYEVEACCGKKIYSLKFNKAIIKEYVKSFTENGFRYIQAYYDAGIFFIEDKGLTASCAFGFNEFQIKCKNKALCPDSINRLENIIKSLV